MKKKDHIVIFPFMAKGHTIPLLHMAAAFSAADLRVTMVTTPANAPILRQYLPSSLHPDVVLLILPFPDFPPLPSGCESTDQLPSFDLFPYFLAATALLRCPFHRLMNGLDSPPLCLISDFFLGWTLDICQQLSIPRIVFHGMSTFSMSICKSFFGKSLTDSTPFRVPGAPSTLLLTRDELPDTVQTSTDLTNPTTQFLNEIGESDIGSWGVLVNSFSDVDSEDYVRLFESFYAQSTNARAWMLGPLSLLSTINCSQDDEEGCIEWLDSQTSPVVYVSFGTQADVSSEQLDEVARGLEKSGYAYLWVVRSTEIKWPAVPPMKKPKGKIVRWAPQGKVLCHEAVEGFVSHCGWNSVMDGVSAGVPFLAWPMIAEQKLNAKHVVDELEIGIRVDCVDEIVGGDVVKDKVTELMEGEKGMKARVRVKQLSKKAKMAVADGGSSRRNLKELIETLRTLRTEGDGVEVQVGDELRFEFRDVITSA